ncbi:hypothetical protein ACHWQZ_G006035 [Mnemiopsis leidyi]
MSTTNEENDFHKILTSTPPSTSSGLGINRTNSWFKKDDNQLVTCPSCKGSGYKETTNELVALIPYSDERLQPRYTTLKITVALVITAIIIGCLFFVFFPRHAGAVSSGLEIISGNVYNDPQHATSLILQDNVTITNDNYFPIVIDTLNISLAISWVGGVQSEVGSIGRSRIDVPAHRDGMTIPYNITTYGYPIDRLFRTCCYVFAGHYIWYRVTINARYKLAFVGNYYFSSSDVKTIAVYCDYSLNKNITCHYN